MIDCSLDSLYLSLS